MTDARITLDAAALKARVATLEAELAEVRAGAAVAVATRDSMERFGNRQAAHANALRDALAIIHNGHGGGAAFIAGEALAQTPAASLAAHRASVLEEVRSTIKARTFPDCDCGGLYYSTLEEMLRALAAQAATHSELEVKP